MGFEPGGGGGVGDKFAPANYGFLSGYGLTIARALSIKNPASRPPRQLLPVVGSGRLAELPYVITRSGGGLVLWLFFSEVISGEDPTFIVTRPSQHPT